MEHPVETMALTSSGRIRKQRKSPSTKMPSLENMINIWYIYMWYISLDHFMYHLYYVILFYICQGMQLCDENAMLGGGTGCTTIPTAVWHSSVHTLISLACTCGWHRIEKNDPKWSKMPQFLFECQDWWPAWIGMGRCRKGNQDMHGDMRSIEVFTRGAM